jgi:hypothetical protein
MDFYIRTATDPDLGTREGLDQHEKATKLFSAKLWALCQDNEVFGNDHERSAELYQRAAFDTALELKVELVQEDIAGGIQFTFNFVPTIKITEVDKYCDRNRSNIDGAHAGEDCYGYNDEDRDAIDAELIQQAEDEAAADESSQGSCECGAGRRPDGSLMCSDPVEPAYDPAAEIADAINPDWDLDLVAKIDRIESEDRATCDTIRDMIETWDSLDSEAQAAAQREAAQRADAADPQYNRFTPGNGLYFCACDGVEAPDVSWCARCRPPYCDEDSPRLDAVNQGGGLWGMTLDGVLVMRDESYAVVHGIIENSDVDELREIRDSLLASSVAEPELKRDEEAIGTRFLSDEPKAARIGRAIAYLLHLTPNDNPDSVRFDTETGDKTYVGLARTLARIFDNEEYRQKLVLDSIDHLPCDPDEETDDEDLEPEFTDGLEDYRGGALA